MDLRGQVTQKLAIAPHTTHGGRRARTCFRSRGRGILIKAGNLSAFGHTPAGEIEWPKHSASVASRPAFVGENVRLCLRRRL